MNTSSPCAVSVAEVGAAAAYDPRMARVPPSARVLSTGKMVALAAGVLLLFVGCCAVGAAVGLGGKGDAGGGATRPAPPVSERPSPTTAQLAAVPKVVGKRLSAAQKELEDKGFTKVVESDASGKDRVVIDADNWIVQSQSPPAGTRTALDAEIRLKVRKPSDGAGSLKTTAGVVPNVVCKDLQDAQDALRDAGFSRVVSEDGSGAGRPQLLDRNWVVIKQSVPAGLKPPQGLPVLLTVVKYGEPTGPSGCKS
jgi:hypothetical protein